MLSRSYGSVVSVLAVGGCLALAAAGCGDDESASGSGGSSSAAAEVKGPPGFTLNDQIDARREGELKIRLSFINPCAAGGPPIKAGIQRAAEEFGVEAEMVGPCSGNVAEQISGAQSLIRLVTIDCLGIMSGGSPDQMVNVTNQAVDEGIPTFAYNVDIPSSTRFAYFGARDADLAKINAETVVEWARKEGKTLKKIALISFEPDATWASDRIDMFKDVVGEAFPGVEFVGPFVEGYTAQENRAAVNSMLVAHSDVDFIFSTDQTEFTAKILDGKGLTGKVYTSGFNYTPGAIQGILNDQTVVTVSQNFPQQGYDTVKACVDFLRDGKLPPEELNYVQGVPITKENASEYVGKTG
jgi:simple sugar transport system substrate-binding protein